MTETIVPPNMLADVTTIPASALGLVNLTNGTAVIVVPVSQTSNGEVQVHFLNTTPDGVAEDLQGADRRRALRSTGKTVPRSDVIDAAGEQTVKVTALFRNGQCATCRPRFPSGAP